MAGKIAAGLVEISGRLLPCYLQADSLVLGLAPAHYARPTRMALPLALPL